MLRLRGGKSVCLALASPQRVAAHSILPLSRAPNTGDPPPRVWSAALFSAAARAPIPTLRLYVAMHPQSGAESPVAPSRHQRLYAGLRSFFSSRRLCYRRSGSLFATLFIKYDLLPETNEYYILYSFMNRSSVYNFEDND